MVVGTDGREGDVGVENVAGGDETDGRGHSSRWRVWLVKSTTITTIRIRKLMSQPDYKLISCLISRIGSLVDTE